MIQSCIERKLKIKSLLRIDKETEYKKTSRKEISEFS